MKHAMLQCTFGDWSVVCVLRFASDRAGTLLGCRHVGPSCGCQASNEASQCCTWHRAAAIRAHTSRCAVAPSCTAQHSTACCPACICRGRFVVVQCMCTAAALLCCRWWFAVVCCGVVCFGPAWGRRCLIKEFAWQSIRNQSQSGSGLLQDPSRSAASTVVCTSVPRIAPSQLQHICGTCMPVASQMLPPPPVGGAELCRTFQVL